MCDSTENCVEDLKINYIKPGHPIAFGGILNIYNYYEGKIPIIKIKDVLKEFESYVLHKEYKQSDRNPSYSHFKRYQWQMDLVDIQALASYNDGIRYILTVVDTFTRYAFCRLLENKQGPLVLHHFQDILQEANSKPITLVIDGGAEFRNSLFLNFCLRNNITVYNPDTSTHGAFIERFNRTLQNLTYKYMKENETYRFKEVFQDLVKTYNNRKHRMIGYTPREAEENPNIHLNIRLRMSKYHEKIKKRKQLFEVGDLVRIATFKGKFSRGYQQKFNDEIFRIYKINVGKKIPLYHLESYDSKEKIKGGFYDFELTKTSRDVFRIEKVLREKITPAGKEYFVKWKGFSDTYNSWVKEADITKIFENV